MANGQRVVITGMGHYHPENKIENSFFDTLDIGSDAAWVEERTGIKSRHSVLSPDCLRRLRNGEVTLEQLRAGGLVPTIADISERAWNVLKSRVDVDSTAIETVICSSSVPDYDIPANACTIAGRIGVEATSFDANSACSSFIVGLHVARGLISSGQAHQIATFVPERYSLRLNYADRTSCVLFGDGAAAALLTANATQGFELLDTMVVSSPSKFDLVQIPDGGHFSQNGKAVQKFAISRTIDVTKGILERNGMTLNDINYLVGHQANLRMLNAAVQKLGIPQEKHLYNVDIYGNQGGAGAPCVMSMNWDRFRSGDIVVVAVVGSGLTWASALLKKL